MSIAALIVAAGRGSRAASVGAAPKQYALIGGRPVLSETIAVFARHPNIDAIQVVIHPDDRPHYQAAVADTCTDKLRMPIPGGATRQASVRAGLEALAAQGEAPDIVLIHDAARPFVAAETIAAVIAALETHKGALAACRVSDTLKQGAADNSVRATVPRQDLWQAQTPQGFHFDAILEAHRRAEDAQRQDFTDDASIAEWAGLTVALVESPARNIKLTTADDIAFADREMRALRMFEPRFASGFDVHRFAAGDHVWLGGVKIPHTHRLEGHSDADVVLHALTDALLGTIGDGDIGQHFPPSDPKWKGAASSLFLEDAMRRVSARGGRIVNADVTILAEAPKIGPHRPAMQATIAKILGLSSDRVGIKATTTEGLGFTGRREGIAAMASATVLLPSS